MSVTKERWRELCKQAAIEKDPQKLLRLYDEINSILQHANSASQPGNVAEKSKSATAR
jgi:hypothetical protein